MSANSQQTSSPTASEHGGHESESAEELEHPGLDVLSLSRAVRKRRAEYTRKRNIRVKIGTWNVASISGTEKDIGKWFVQGEGVSEKLSGSKFAPGEGPDSIAGKT